MWNNHIQLYRADNLSQQYIYRYPFSYSSDVSHICIIWNVNGVLPCVPPVLGTERKMSWASCQISKIAGAHAPGMPGTFSPPPRVSDSDMHHGTCVTHVPWCIPGSLTRGFLWIRRRGNLSRHSRRMRNPQFYISGKRPKLNHFVTGCSDAAIDERFLIMSAIPFHWGEGGTATWLHTAIRVKWVPTNIWDDYSVPSSQFLADEYCPCFIALLIVIYIEYHSHCGIPMLAIVRHNTVFVSYPVWRNRWDIFPVYGILLGMSRVWTTSSIDDFFKCEIILTWETWQLLYSHL